MKRQGLKCTQHVWVREVRRRGCRCRERGWPDSLPGSPVDRSQNCGVCRGLCPLWHEHGGALGVTEPFLHPDWCGGLQRHPGPSPWTCGTALCERGTFADAIRIRTLRCGNRPGWFETGRHRRWEDSWEGLWAGDQGSKGWGHSILRTTSRGRTRPGPSFCPGASEGGLRQHPDHGCQTVREKMCTGLTLPPNLACSHLFCSPWKYSWNAGRKFFKRWEFQTTWPASWEICIQVKKQQLEQDMEQQDMVLDWERSTAKLYIATLLI